MSTGNDWTISDSDLGRLLGGEHSDPHAVLGIHPSAAGRVVRAYHPDAIAAEMVLDDLVVPLALVEGGVFEEPLGVREPRTSYRIRFSFADGVSWERGDPYCFLPTLGELDLHLFGEGTHRRLWECLGAHPCRIDGVAGVRFAVWAPNARRVSVMGDFCGWDGRLLPMRSLGASGVFELFVPGWPAGSLYKFEILSHDGSLHIKADPFAFAAELPPSTASKVYENGQYTWGDGDWMDARSQTDHHRSPMRIYEAHLGSWRRHSEDRNRCCTYRELASDLVQHVKALGFTHIELMPVAEHPFDGSWGYQVTGYFAPTSRYGSPDDFRYFVDACHQAGIGVLVDWVPAHFPRDAFGLARFDGTALFEHADPRLGEHPDWGTLIFNYGRNEVRNFLIANALYWLSELHVDGLRVDAVASMLYLDYSRKEGQWLPNRYGGRENLEAVDFLRALNETIRLEAPGCFTVAEESTSWGGVTAPTEQGGLGFSFKWNMGWMHDTLKYMAYDPIYRRYHQDELTFAMIYEHSEQFIMPLSHDEVVHGKGSLLAKMPGDEWQRVANLRLLYAYQSTRPGKSLLFMGAELAPESEWNHAVSLDWGLAHASSRQGLARLLADLGALEAEHSCFSAGDPDGDGFAWIDCNDRDNSVISFERRFGDSRAIVVVNLTPVPRENYRIGASWPGSYRERLNTDAGVYHGSDFPTTGDTATEPVPFHGRAQSLLLRLPPLSVLVLLPDSSVG